MITITEGKLYEYHGESDACPYSVLDEAKKEFPFPRKDVDGFLIIDDNEYIIKSVDWFKKWLGEKD